MFIYYLKRMFFITLLLFGAANASLEEYETKIINGSLSFIDDYPYMVSLQVWGSHMCGGAILDEVTILTAAHCLKLAKHIPMRWFLKIQAGSTKLYENGQTIGVYSIHDHPKYNSKTSDYDIAVLKLKSKLKFNGRVKPVELPTERAPTGSVASAAGWGKTTSTGGISTLLYAVQLPVLEQQTCVNSYPNEMVNERMLCAGYLEGGKDTCQGDSGGPLVYKNTVIGVVSWGYGCAQAGRPGVFADISQFLDYIQESL